MRWVTSIVVLICVWLIFLAYWGYGHVTLHLPAGTQVEINGHNLSHTNQTIKLRPGSYYLNTKSARHFSTHNIIHVSLFRTTNYTPKTTERSSESIAYATYGVSTNNGPPPVYNTRWFGDTWVVEDVGFSTPSILAAHYQNGRWHKGYLTGEMTNISKLPIDVAQEVNERERAINASL